MRLSFFYILFCFAVLSACKVVLPHAGYLPGALPLPKPIFRGTDTNAFSFSVGYNGVNLPGNDEDFSVFGDPTEPKSGLLSSASGELSWSAVHNTFYYGFGAFGYLGNYILRQDSITLLNQSYGGIGLKGGLGVSVHGKKVSWHIVGLQGSLATDFGKYPDYREVLFNVNALEPNPQIVPGNALATTLLFTTQADFFTRSKVGFSLQLGYCIHGYWHNGLQNYSRAMIGGPVLRINNMLIGYTSYLASNAAGGGDLRLTVLF